MKAFADVLYLVGENIAKSHENPTWSADMSDQLGVLSGIFRPSLEEFEPIK